MVDIVETSSGGTQQLIELVTTGGPVVVVLLAFSVAGTAVVLVKMWHFARLGLGAESGLQAAVLAWSSRGDPAALEHLRGLAHPAARLVVLLADGRDRAAVSEAMLREEVGRVAQAQLQDLQRHLPLLELVGSLSPLLGLLGTVLGMIEAFRQLEAAGSQVDPAILSGGIWEALLTTAVGLAVAIPAVMAGSWLDARVQRCRQTMEDVVTRALTRPLQGALYASASGAEVLAGARSGAA